MAINIARNERIKQLATNAINNASGDRRSAEPPKFDGDVTSSVGNFFTKRIKLISDSALLPL